MRVSSDANSWRADSAIRRDLRARRDTPEIPRGPKSVAGPRPRKDRRRWCGGRVGVEHRLEVARTHLWPRNRFEGGRWVTVYETVHVYRCAGCGRYDWRLPATVRAQVDPLYARHVALAARWCRDGHLYDRVPLRFDPDRTEKICVMCGHRPNRARPVAVTDPATLS